VQTALARFESAAVIAGVLFESRSRGAVKMNAETAVIVTEVSPDDEAGAPVGEDAVLLVL
jgi:hypothetical protein